MTIIKTESYSDGSHIVQIYPEVIDPKTEPDFIIPDGYAIISDDITIFKNFPYGNVEVSEINGFPMVTKWIPLPIPDPPKTGSTKDLLDALIQ